MLTIKEILIDLGGGDNISFRRFLLVFIFCLYASPDLYPICVAADINLRSIT
jgi:hypothetical protein